MGTFWKNVPVQTSQFAELDNVSEEPMEEEKGYNTVRKHRRARFQFTHQIPENASPELVQYSQVHLDTRFGRQYIGKKKGKRGSSTNEFKMELDEEDEYYKNLFK